MLVAMAAMSVLFVMLSKAIDLTSKTISANSRKLNAVGQTRLFFDRLASDLAARPSRSDLGMVFTKDVGNDSFRFYSGVNGYGGARQVSSVGYRIQQTTAGRVYQLERGAEALDWGPAASPKQLVQFLPNLLPPPLASDLAYKVLAKGILRLEVSYLLNTGLMSTSANSDFSDVMAVFVAVGVMDVSTLQSMSNTHLQQLSNSLPDCVDGKDPLSCWSSAMAQTEFAKGVPQAAIQNLRIYQRAFYVH